MNDLNRINIGTWKKELRLYVHVPFCVKKCDYCDFLSASSDEEGIKSYFEALYKEIRSYGGMTKDYLVSSVFIGGGTPSCVDSKYIVGTLRELRSIFKFSTEVEPEITIEVNPGFNEIKRPRQNEINQSRVAIERKLLDYKEAGINRLSFGLQSIHEHELKMLGRIHSYLDFEENYYLAREYGFDNINIDLISALPGQSIESWEATLHKVTSLEPEHISAYSLIIEEGTPFYDIYGPDGSNKYKLPSEEIDRMIYARTKEILLSYGYKRYEISNYAKKGYKCSHNLAYWEGVSYLGLGLGSSSLIGNIRFSNINILHEYIDLINNKHKKIVSKDINDKENIGLLYDVFDIRRDIITLTKDEQIEEFMFLGLRKTNGISKLEFFKRFNRTIDEVYGDLLKRLEKDQLIIIKDDMVRLTELGIDISNKVLAEFLF